MHNDNVPPIDIRVAAEMLRCAKAQLVKQTALTKQAKLAYLAAQDLERDMQTKVEYAEARLLASV